MPQPRTWQYFLSQAIAAITLLQFTVVWAIAIAEGQSATATTNADILIADFEEATYGMWKATGDAFGPGPAAGTLAGQMQVEGFQGQRLVNSFFRGDDATGTLTSPEFRIERRFISFFIGGGMNADKLALQLRVGDSVVRSSTGSNDKAGGSETLMPESWDVSELVGKSAVLRIVDDAKGGWGHINVDHIVQTDRKPPGLVTNAERVVSVNSRYLHFPIKNGIAKRLVTLLVDGQVQVANEMELAASDADWWATMDIGAWQGKQITLRVDKMPEESKGLALIEQSDTLKDGESLYRESLRGQFHFSPQRGWNNDPNGLVYFNNEYHLFFQHNPYGWGWGNMHWGHAVSRDLVHWKELGDKLMPDELGPMFSGSAVVDWKNSSGLGADGHPPLVLIYTAAGNPTVQCLASSIDGRKFTKFGGNPVLKQVTSGNRDPKVFWHEPSQQWVMVLYVELPGPKHTVHFFNSPNLRDWKLASVTEGIAGSNYLFECPDFFELPIDGDMTQKKWVLTAANGEYAIGTFDGSKFTPEQSKLAGHQGRGFYAAQSYSDIPANDGRRIQFGWFQTETKGMSFNQSMTIPLELKLTSTSDGPRMTVAPVRELNALRVKKHQFDGLSLSADSANPLAKIDAELVELRAEFNPRDATDLLFDIRGASVKFDIAKHELVVNGHRAAVPVRGERQTITIYCDRTGLEVFASDGMTYIPMPFQPKPEQRQIKISVSGGNVDFKALEVYELRSAWDRGI